MDHVFLCAAYNKDIITELSAIRSNGRIGYLNEKTVIAAFTSRVNGNLKEILASLKLKLCTDNSKFIVVAYSAELIRSVIKHSLKETLFAERIWVDVNQLAWPLLYNGMIPNRQLDTLCNHFKVPIKPEHDSADDCAALMQIYAQIMQRYKTSLLAEETVREVGGDMLESLRKMIQF